MKRLCKVLALIFLFAIIFGANAWAGEVITGNFEAWPGWSPEGEVVIMGVTIVGPPGIFASGITLETRNAVPISGPPPVNLTPIFQEFITFAQGLNCTVGNPVPDDFMPDRAAVYFVCQGIWNKLPMKAATLLEFPLTFILEPSTTPD